MIEGTTPEESTVVAEVTARGTAVPGEAVEMTAGMGEMDNGKIDARATKEAAMLAVEDTRVVVTATDETQGTIPTSKGLGGTTDLLQHLPKPNCI